VEFSQNSKFKASNMTKIADIDLLELRKLILLLKSECHKVKIWDFNTFKIGIFYKNQNSCPPK